MADEKGILSQLMNSPMGAAVGYHARPIGGIIDALMLPGQVAGGIMNVKPERPGYWSDTDEARSQLTNQTMMQRASDLGGLLMLGASGAPAVPNSVGMGVRSVPQTNYLEPLSKYTKNVYREASPEAALYDLPGSTRQGGLYAGSPPKQFYADTPDMALGQGANRGVRVGYDAGAFQGQINQNKPGWQPAFENGMGEYIASPMKDANVRDAVNSISIDKEMLAQAPRAVRANYNFVQDKLRQSGWELTDTGKTLEWVKKVAPPVERIQGAAFKFGDEIFTGINHGDAYEAAIKKLGFDPLGAPSSSMGRGASGANTAERRGLNGFMTSSGRFVSREEAAKIAEAASQVSGPRRGLMAHDLD